MPESTVWLEDKKPDVIIADECHLLRHNESVRTSRVSRYFENHDETRFLSWSGSITDSSIKDYAHLAAWGLKYGSPLPLDAQVIDEWSLALDPVAVPAPAGALLKLCNPGENVRHGFSRRLTQTPGVVSTKEPAVSAALSITERKAPTIPTVVSDALKDLRGTWCRPDGEELVDALSVARCAWELACGFYYRWRFPRGEKVALILRWLEARKAWRKELRAKVQDRRDHMDSPALCTNAAKRAWGDMVNPEGLPEWKALHWPAWRAIKDQVIPETEAIRLHPYLAEDAAAWAHENRGVVWYEHRAFGAWVSEIGDLPMHGGGSKAGDLIALEQGDRSIVASIKAHGTGRDGLQKLFDKQLIANPPSSSHAWEQVVGRLHRIGQKSSLVTAEFYRHTPELKDHVDTALERALYVEGTLGSSQKLLLGIDLKHR
jgi:hypothetical protein